MAKTKYFLYFHSVKSEADCMQSSMKYLPEIIILKQGLIPFTVNALLYVFIFFLVEFIRFTTYVFPQGKFLWPGFGENSRVLDWVLRRCEDESCHKETPLGFMPADGSLNTQNLGEIDMKELFSIPKDFWMQEVG